MLYREPLVKSRSDIIMLLDLKNYKQILLVKFQWSKINKNNLLNCYITLGKSYIIHTLSDETITLFPFLRMEIESLWDMKFRGADSSNYTRFNLGAKGFFVHTTIEVLLKKKLKLKIYPLIFGVNATKKLFNEWLIAFFV